MDGKLRVRKYREKLIGNPEKRQEYLAKDRAKAKTRREENKKKRTKEEEELFRSYNRNRQRELRQRKKNEENLAVGYSRTPLGPLQPESEQTPSNFKSRRSIKRAVTKLKQGLPKQEDLRKEVLKEIALEVLPKHLKKAILPKKTFEGLEAEEAQKIQDFYMQDEISRATPGIREFKSVKNPITRKRENLQKRYMLMSIGESFQLFKTQHPEIVVGKTSFYALRPKNVVPVTQTPHNVCVCIYHGNMNYLIEAARKTEGMKSFPASTKDLLSSLCCDLTSETCMTNACLKCEELDDIMPLKMNLDKKITWKQWKEVNGRLQVCWEESTIAEFLDVLNSKLKSFKPHWYVKAVQSKVFDEKKGSIDVGECVLQVDFAENYEIISQDEIQSAHWRHAQVTVFTACAWINDGKERSHQSYALISDDLSHSKESVWVFLKSIIEDLKKNTVLHKVHVFSDGCAAQFKSRYNLLNLCTAEEDFGVQLTWTFFPTSHGKGAVDGIGAVIKRQLWTSTKAREVVLNSPKDCFNFLKKKEKTVKLLFVEKHEVEVKKEFLNARWQNVKTIKKLHSRHYFEKTESLDHAVQAGFTATSKLMKHVLKDTKLRYCDVYSDSDD